MKVLITGASGFLGSALARQLAAAGHDLALLLRPGSSMRRLENDAPEWRIGRCSNDAEIKAFVDAAAPDAVIHAACAYGRKGETPLQLLDTNLRFGAAVIQALAETAPSRHITFIHTDTCLAPEVSAYAQSKRQFAQWGHSVAARGDSRLQFINLRLQHMYGPGEDRTHFVAHVLHSCRENQAVLALTAGEQRRDFIHVDDVLRAVDAVLAHRKDLQASEDIDLGTGDATPVRMLVETVHQLTASCTRLDFGALPYRANEAMFCRADITRMQQLGWQPAHTLRSGLKKTIDMEFPA